MEVTVEAALATAARRLDRHDAAETPRRTDGHGPDRASRESAALLSRWAADRGRSLAWLESGVARARELAEAWTGRLAAGGCLVGEAMAWLERQLGRPAGSLGPSLRGKTPFELRLFLDGALPSVSPTGVETVCRWASAMRRSGAGVKMSASITASSAMCSNPGRWRALGSTPDFARDRPRRLVPPERQPVLVLARRVRRGTTGRGRAGTLGRAGRPAPCRPGPRPAPPGGLPGAGARPAGLTWDGPRSRGPRRSCGVDRDGPGAEEEISAARSEGEPAASGAAGPAAVRGAGRGRRTARPRRPDARPRGGRSRPQRGGAVLLRAARGDAGDRGAVPAERDARLPVRPQPQDGDRPHRPALSLAVEIDGYYHFQDPDAYRRDRRKDLELQKRVTWSSACWPRTSSAGWGARDHPRRRRVPFAGREFPRGNA